MADFNVRSDSVNVEQIMEQIRARIREKRGVDYTEEQLRELAAVKLEKFLDPRGVRSDLLEQFKRRQPTYEPPLLPTLTFEDTTLYETHRGVLRSIRRLLNPILKLFFNPNPLIEALHIQSRLNESYNRSEALSYELIHNLVLELTRASIEVKNLKMRLESIASRLDFDERRARALEGVVQYRPGAVPPLQPPTGSPSQTDTDGNERRTRRRRRRGRRHGGGAGGPHGEAGPATGGGAGTGSGQGARDAAPQAPASDTPPSAPDRSDS